MKVFGIAGRSGSGKTSLLEQLIPCLRAKGLRVSIIKHSHHGFDIDRPGKDSYRHREAGAEEVMLACNARWALMREVRDEAEPELGDLLARLAPVDLVLVEGFKQESIPKLEVYRPAWERPPLYTERQDIMAIATDAQLDTHLPCLPLNEPEVIAAYIVRSLNLEKPSC